MLFKRQANADYVHNRIAGADRKARAGFDMHHRDGVVGRQGTRRHADVGARRGLEIIGRRCTKTADRINKSAVCEVRDIGGADDLYNRHRRRMGGEERGDASSQQKHPRPAPGNQPEHQRGGLGLAIRQRRCDGAGKIRPRLHDERQRSDYVGNKHG